MNKKIRREKFSTTHLNLASALLAKGFKLEELKRVTPSRAEFLFRKTERLDKAMEMFWAGEMRIEPKAYYQAEREIKSRIYDQK